MIGISSACFYPMLTENTLEHLAKTGVSVIEIFCNTESELTPSFADEMRRKCDACGISIVSVHPYTSFAEPYYFFSDYARRTDDATELYKRFFEATNRFGATLFQFHGDRKDSGIATEVYAERYVRLFRLAKEQGVTFCQENVCRCRSAELSFLTELSDRLGDEVRFTLDLKQAHRSGVDPLDIVSVLGKKIAHLHVNDRNGAEDCLLPGYGTFDFASFSDRMAQLDYRGHWMIEVYSQNYGNDSELCRSVEYLKHTVQTT